MAIIPFFAQGVAAPIGVLPFWARVTTGFEGDTYSKNPELLVVLGGQRIPGVSRVKAAPELQVDIQKVHGSDGGTLIARGYMPGPIEIETVIWTPEQWSAMQMVIALVWRKPGKIASSDKKATQSQLAEQSAVAERRALPIEHPYLQWFGIASVVVTGISPPEPGPFEQSRVIRIKCVEYVPRTKSTADAVQKVSGQGNVVPLVKEFQPANGNTVPPSTTQGGP